MICEVCDQPGELTTMHGFSLHEKCAPTYWVVDHQKRDRFMAAVRTLATDRAETWAKRDERKT